MAYELNVHAGVSGADQLDRLGASTDKQTERTTRLNSAIQQYAASNDKLLAKHLELQQAETRLESLREQHRMQTERLAASTSKAAATQEKLATSTQHMTTSTIAATVALRDLEGGMNLRGAARFLSTIQGIGPALQAAFPLLGAIALVSTIEQIGSKLGLHLNVWKEIEQEQKKSNQMLQDASSEYTKQLGQLKEIQQREYERTHGAAAGAVRSTTTELPGVEGQIQSVSAQIETLRAIAQGKLPSAGFGMFRLTPSQALYAGMAGLDVTSTVQGQQVPGSAAAIAAGRISALERQLSALQVQRETLLASGSAALNQPAEQAQRDAEQRASAAQTREQRLQEMEKRAMGVYTTATARNEGFGGAYDAQRARIAAERADQLRQHPEDATRINRAYELQDVAAYADFRREFQKNQQELAKVMSEIPPAIKDDLKSLSQSLTSFLSEMTGAEKGAPPPGYITPQEQLRRARNAGTFALRSARNGSPDETYGIRIQSADAIYQAELRIAKTEEDRLNAEDQKKQALFEAEMERQEKLDALRQQDFQYYEQMAGSLFDAIHGRTTGQYFHNFGMGQVRTLFSNATAPLLQGAGHLLGGLIPNPSIPGFGNILRGTIFDNANADPAKSTADNTKGIWNEVRGLRNDIRGVFGGSSLPGTSAAPTISDLASLPLNHSMTSMLGMLSPLGAIFGGGTSGTTLSSNMPGWPYVMNATSGSPSGFSQFFSGMGMGGTNPIGAILTGQANGPGWGANLSTTQRVGVGVGTAAALGGAGYGIYSGIHEGGAGGYTQAAASALGGASLFAGPAAPILAGAAALTGLIGSLLQTGPQQRSKDIYNELSSNAYLAPTALNVTQGMNGTYEDFGIRGDLRTSTMSAVPTVAEPYITSRVVNGQRTYYDVPGGVQAPYTSGPTGTGQAPIANTGTTVIINGGVQAMDSESFHSFLQKNTAAVGDAVTTHLQSGGERLAAQMRYHVNG